MKRTQLNVSIDPKLLEKIKESARLSGKSLVSFVSDCFINQIENLPIESLDSRFHTIEQRLKSIEENNKSYIRSSYEESLNTQALIEAAIKSQNSNKMELVEKI